MAIISPQRSKGTTMSPAVFSILRIERALGRADALVHPGGHGLANGEEIRRAPSVVRERQLGVREDPGALQQRGRSVPERRCRASSSERSLNLLERLRGVRLGAELQLHEQRERRPFGYRDVVPRVRAVLADDLERPAVHVLDRARVDSIHARRSAASRSTRRAEP